MPPSARAWKSPSWTSMSTSCSNASGSTAPSAFWSPSTSAAAPRTAVTALELRDLLEGGGDRRRQRLERLVGDDVVGLHAALEHLGERRAQRRGEHGGRAHEGDADHQGGRRRRRAARRPAGVLPGEHAGRLEQLADRPADQPGHRPGDRRRHAGHAEEDQQGADAGERERAHRAAGRHEQPDQEADDAERRDDRAADEAALAERLEAELGTHRRDRRAPWPPGGPG